MDDIYEMMEEASKKAHEALRSGFNRLRTGRANAGILDSIKVDYYGSITPLAQMASITTPEPRLIMVKPWDKTAVADVEKAIMSADIGLNPMNDGEIIRIPVPQLTEERRQEIVKVVKKQGEECKISIRNSRRDCNDLLKDMEKEKSASEDEVARALKRIQELTDKAVKAVDELIETKEKEVLEV